MEEFRNDVVIIHYAGYTKPWSTVVLSNAAYRKWYRYTTFDYWTGKVKSKAVRLLHGVK